MKMPRVRQQVRVDVKTRARIVASALFEWIKLAGGSLDGLEELLNQGIANEQIIQSICLTFSKPDGDIVAMIEFVIDWNSSTLSLRGSDAALLGGLDEGAPITAQVAKILTKMIHEVSGTARKKKGARDPTITFRYIPNLLRQTGKSQDDWNKELGCSAVSQTDAEKMESYRRIYIRDRDLGGMVGVNFTLNMNIFKI